MKTIPLLSSLAVIVSITLVLGGIYPPEQPVHAETAVPKAVQAPLKTKTINVPSEAPVAPAPTPAQPQAPLDNESTIWNYLVGKGYSRNQTAGIMGNLMQEHHFKTSDVAGGLGIAQWMGGRRDNLIAKGNYLDLNVQLDFLMEELNGGYADANRQIRAVDSVENAVIVFQNQFERCGVCMEGTRMSYAYQILANH